MFIRETLTRRTANKTHRSVRLVEGRRDGHKAQKKSTPLPLFGLWTSEVTPKEKL